MDDPSIKKRLIDFGTDEHEYDEVQELPEESSNQHNADSHSTGEGAGATIAAVGGSTAAAADAELPPELPPPKQKSVKNSKNKQKLKSANKSKIPRSPSLASSLSCLASSISGNHNTNNNVPPQTPPLPASYQQQNKAKHMNGGGATPAATPTSPTGFNNANNNSINSTIMGGGVQLNPSNISGGGVAQRGSLNLSTSASSASAATRRPQIQISSIAEAQATTPTTPNSASPKNFQYLTLTVRKDEIGYGMKVSGDNPVFVESVKPGGAAQIAGLVAGDMILKVNGQEVRLEKHPTVVSLIKASTVVELAVKRSHKISRPSSVGIVPSTPVLSGRDRTASITGPQPVDSIKRREMETYKIQTLQKMLEQEKLNLERLKGDTNNPSYKLSEANIRTLRDQLRQVGAEDAPIIKYHPTANNKNNAMLTPNQIQHLSASANTTTSNTNTTHYQQQLHHQQQHHHIHNNNNNNHHQQQASTPQPQPAHSSPAFLSLLPRSLSSLSLGTRKNKIEKEFITSPLNNTTDFLHHQRQQQHQQQHATVVTTPDAFNAMSQSLHQHTSTPSMQQQQQQQQRNSPQPYYYQQQQQLQQRFKETPKSAAASKSKSKFTISKSLIEEDIPPPLPQRNPPRQLALDLSNGNGSPNSSHLFAPISDLDRASSPQRNASPIAANGSGNNTNNNSPSNAKSKRSKTKTKALSDPKMSTQMFLQMETVSGAGAGGAAAAGGFSTGLDCVPPPLPPRQPGMLVEELNRGSCQNLSGGRAPPNSIGTVFNYPLVSTCTAVQNDNMAAAFPLSQRPNIVQQLQQHQQHQQQQQQLGGVPTAALGQTPHLSQMKHRRVGSSPDNMHPRHPDRLTKTTSGSWELVEKDGEITPPGTPPPPYLTSSHMSVPEDPNENCSGGSGIFVESHHFTPLGAAATSPLPPSLHSSRIQAAQSIDTQKEIISMEDENSSDQEEPFIDENGPFNNLTRLLEVENVVFLAVFLNYVLSNSEPAPLLFYLITELYKEGTSKDMRKWAYEIHSTFLVPRAPLSWYRQDESLAREVDNVLQSEFDKVEILRTVFLRSRKRAKDIISEQLREFQQKRMEGLGTIYGPTDDKLAEAKGDKQRELIIDKYLMPNLQIIIEEYERDLPLEDPRKLALCSALSTVIHRIFNTRSHPNSIVDRVHHFVSREKSFKSRLMGKNRKMTVRGHPLVLRQYYEVTHCNHCQTIIWGVSPQGYHCTDCKLNIHRLCSKILEENCPGPLPQAKRNPHNDNKISKFMGKIRPRTSDFIANEKRARQDEDMDVDFSNERLHNSSIVRQPSDRRPDANISLRSNGNASANSSALNSSDLQSSFHAASSANDSIGGSGSCTAGPSELTTSTGSTALVSSLLGAVGLSGATSGDLNAQDADAQNKDARRERYHQHPQHKSAPVSVNRSESYKERLTSKRNRNSRRKTSDPSLPSRPNDDQPDLGLSNSNHTASSDSSLSCGSESPSTSMEQVGGGAAAGATATQSAISSSLHPHLQIQQHAHQNSHSHSDSFHGSLGSAGSGPVGQLRQWNFESSDEDDLNEADWSSMVAADMLAALTDAEKKRQEIINEIYHTERSYVRTLKLLDRLFFLPLYESGLLSQDHLLLLFPPALLSLRELHGNFEQKLKQRRLEHNHVVNHIGDLLADMFDGQSGEQLREHAVQFCARQKIALEALKEKRHKDEQLQKLLRKSESHKACRRLELKDLLPTVLQRLTKYPLLFGNLYKVTVRVLPENTSEAEAIQCALESTKRILVEVNKAVKTTEDAHKLQNIQRKLDKSSLDKDSELKKLDLTQHRLMYDGNLTMKKNPSIQLHGLLFENMIVLLTKQDDKYLLKNLHIPPAANNKPVPVSPVMTIDSETLVRQEAADKNSFFLIKTKTSQMLELRAPTGSECKTWFKHISDAAAQQYKPRSKNANNHDTTVDDPAIATIPHSNTKESLELTPERMPQPATATVTTTPLAPLLPVATATAAPLANSSYDGGVQLRNGRRESTPSSLGDHGSYFNLTSAAAKQRLSHNETGAINRTMSTRSCGEAINNSNNNHYGAGGAGLDLNGVALRHTQSARHANGNGSGESNEERSSTYGLVGGPSKRDSASIVCSNNSNDTRTLLMQSPLVDPTAIQISISPAHTAEPVLTPGEKLRRLDAAIRDGLLEKQKIICDIFRLPVEHFNEIVDIAMMPEAPKDSADIALAAYDQVQSLTKVLNEYMHVTPEQQISAVSTAICDQCHGKEKEKLLRKSATPASVSTVHSSSASSPPPPPLPPPNKQPAQQQTPKSKAMPKLHTPVVVDEVAIHEDDDGYCEIDELRLPAIPAKSPSAPSGPSTPLAPFKSPPNNNNNAEQPALSNSNNASGQSNSPELIKRQSTISADSIPEESADELHKALTGETSNLEKEPTTTVEDAAADAGVDAERAEAVAEAIAEKVKTIKTEGLAEVEAAAGVHDVMATVEAVESTADSTTITTVAAPPSTAEPQSHKILETSTTNVEEAANSSSSEHIEVNDVYDTLVAPKPHVTLSTTTTTTVTTSTAEPQSFKSEEISTSTTAALEEGGTAENTANSTNSKHIELNDVYDTLAALNKAHVTLSMIDNSTQTAQPLLLPMSPTTKAPGATTSTGTGTTCGPNRLLHASSLEPSVPCHALSNIVSVLNEQISLLLPKINERDMERERLRKENQHLRELLSAMHERNRVDATKETPTDIRTILLAADAEFEDEIDAVSNTSLTPTPTPLPPTTPAGSSGNSTTIGGESEH
ncbi:uncharacterized protein LOC115633450 isoform X2 [Scaptodrosophila lebanonensis]|uniref:Uncharacterized protein LOC115633450 isoform X2 n=1 Tax=Drosophila lebanonensis TaxID=7225 RepID=A0A6J2UH59_DROLE|nr:uncharacterized protein LOC115633450 isoform X2 [Scaptodrosophila lebanonensis]